MRHVHPTEQVIHLWAHQSQPDARNPSGNVFFDGPTIYSYGRHFPMARLHKNKRGVLVLLNDGHYSKTTGKHQGWVAGAVRHLDYMRVPEVNPGGKTDHDKNLAHFAGIMADSLVKAQRAMQRRTVAGYRSTASTAEDHWQQYAAFFGIRRKAPKWPGEAWEAAAARAARIETPDPVRDAKRFKALQAREAATLARFEAKREAWRAREQDHARAIWRMTRAERNQWHALPCMLRVNGDELETSQGARIPLDHAPRLWKLIQAVRAAGRPYERNGHTEHAGQFAIDGIDAAGNLRAGCHKIEYPELERMARTLGLAQSALDRHMEKCDMPQGAEGVA